MDEIIKAFASFNNRNIIVIGDAMIDSYLWGKVDRISPEAPIPIVSVQKKEMRPGGAANVALNVKALGANAFLYSVTGNDTEAEIFIKLLENSKLSAQGILKSPERITTVKTRIIGKNQHMLRVDEEITWPLSKNTEQVFISKILEGIDSLHADAIIFEDYDKGVITPGLIKKIVEKANQKNIPVFVDPKYNNFHHYQNVTLFKPNYKEFINGLKTDISKRDTADLLNQCESFRKKNNIDCVLLTLSENGLVVSSSEKNMHMNAHEVEIVDVSGAGDTVISVAALCFIAGLAIDKVAYISNLAGSQVCEKVGVVQVDKELLLNKLKEHYLK